MDKVLLLIKATKSELNIFNKNIQNSINSKSSTFKKVVLVTFLALVIMSSVAIYAFMFGSALNQYNMTEYLIVIFSFAAFCASFMMAITKSQGVLFSSKDNDLLLSLPISKTAIFATRIIKLILYQYMIVAIIMIPSIVVYSIFVTPSFVFILKTLLLTITLPIVPTILGSLVGYITCIIASKTKRSNIMQIVTTFAFAIVIFLLSFNLDTYVENIQNMVGDIYSKISAIYIPIRWYMEAIQQNNIISGLLMTFVPFAVLAIAIYLFGINYYHVISKLSEKHANKKYIKKEIKTSSAFSALVKKEFARFFSSSVYVVNTMFGIVLLTIGAGYLLFNGTNAIAEQQEIKQVIDLLPQIMILALSFVIGTCNISSSSISIEGKNFWQLKTLPVDVSMIFNAKIIAHVAIVAPLLIIIATIILVLIPVGTITSILLVLAIVSMVLFHSTFGLAVNLKHPRLDATELVIVKQSLASFIGIFGGMIILAVLFVPYFLLSLTVNQYLFIYIIVLLALTKLLKFYLDKQGKKIFSKI